MLERQGFKIAAANNGEKAIQLAQDEKPDLIILDVMMPGMDGYEVTRRLRALDSTAFIPIILFTAKAQVDDKVEGFESGADDYLTKPTHPAELIARVKTILTRPKTGSLVAPDTAPHFENTQGYGVIAAKGGIGVSTLALNLAVAIHRQTKEYVTLVDFRPGYGTLGLQLGYTKSHALTDLLKKNAGEIRVEDVENQLITHGSGIQLLLSSFAPADADLQNAAENYEVIAKHLLRIAPYTVFDLGMGLHDGNRRILTICNKVIVLVESNPATIRQTKELLTNLTALGIDQEKIKLVLLNRFRMEITIPADQVGQDLGIPLAGVIVPAPELAYQAITRNEPMVLFQPGSMVANQYIKLASTITVEER